PIGNTELERLAQRIGRQQPELRKALLRNIDIAAAKGHHDRRAVEHAHGEGEAVMEAEIARRLQHIGAARIYLRATLDLAPAERRLPGLHELDDRIALDEVLFEIDLQPFLRPSLQEYSLFQLTRASLGSRQGAGDHGGEAKG